jgi:hypothetical protein
MKFLHYVHLGLIAVFAAINALMLYLFLMKLPYDIHVFFASLDHWDEQQPRIGIVSAIVLTAAMAGGWFAWRMPEDWKYRLLYFRWFFPHPAFNAFLTTRKQPFESKALLKAFPGVKDAGFSSSIQIETWKQCLDRHADVPVVINTRIHWDMLRDLYVLSLIFLILFFLGYLFLIGVPFQFVAIYMFVFGAQFLFLLLSARRVGYKLVDNVLAVSLGMDDKDQGLGSGKGGRRVI